MSKIYGLTQNDILPQSDFKASQNENGGWDGSQSFIILKGGLDNAVIRSYFQTGKTAKDLDPNCDSFFSFLKLVSVSDVENIEPGFTKISATYTGYWSATYGEGGAEDVLPTYSLRGTLTDAPLNEHKKWKDLSDTEKWALGMLINGDAISNSNFTNIGSINEDTNTFNKWTDSSGNVVTLTGDAVEFAKRIAQGKTTYKMATYSWVKSWEQTAPLTSDQLNELSKITTPPGNPPKPSGTRDWLMTDVAQEQYGTGEYKHRVELSFLLSDDGGHDSFLQST